MGTFEVIGGKKLKGEITPQGAKNEALQVISGGIVFHVFNIFHCANVLI
ncbi:MAG: hypothetical protein M3R50_11495 [Bacteroidota bacterium]|nr:hypothetical protein [Bacteroidota bacterium]